MNTHRFHSSLTVVLVLLVALATASSALAFDDERKGFTLGLGFGVSPWATLQGEDEGTELKDEGAGPGASLAVGIGLNDRDVLALTINWASIGSDLYGDSALQVFKGFTWSHYFGRPGRSFFSTLGYGSYEYDWQGSRHYICWGDECDPPPRLPGDGGRTGYLLGAGYEFALHWQLGAYAALGRPEYEGDFSFTHVTILVQYNWF